MDFQRQRLPPRPSPQPIRARPVEPAGPGNQALQEQLRAQATVTLSKTLKVGSRGEEVKLLQSFLGLQPSGSFDEATRRALAAWQKGKGLDDDGIAGPDTRTVLSGKPLLKKDGLTSPHHDDSKFVPTYRATAQSESDMYRTKDDPYAVGAISKPSKDEDLGGKTYGTYQFESYVYKDGTHASDALRDNSTVIRFINWDKNPFGAELKVVLKASGVASDAFDKKWAELTKRDNKGFGKAQQDFLLVDAKAKVDAFFDRAEIDPAARKDARLFDVVLGTLNQYFTLANGMADHIAATQKAAKKKLSVDEIGVALQDYKWGKVSAHFKSSPKAHTGIRNRVNREGALFEGYEKKALPK
jgi:hypothetical protein